MDRKELISSREYWIEMISSKLWNNTELKYNSPKCDRVASDIVDKNFMKIIKEIYSQAIETTNI